jgi:hypothetical protein
MERTILGNIKDLSKIGGLEELLRCLSMVTVVDEEKLLKYLAFYKSQFVYQKAGYILFYYKTLNYAPLFLISAKTDW